MDGIILTSLRQIQNKKGNIFHALKKSDEGYCGFGEAYFSSVNLNETKGWKKHTKMTLNLVVIKGEIEFVIYDDSSKNFFNVRLSKNNYQRLTVLPNMWLAFKGIKQENILLNIANVEHDPTEAINEHLSAFHYEW